MREDKIDQLLINCSVRCQNKNPKGLARTPSASKKCEQKVREISPATRVETAEGFSCGTKRSQFQKKRLPATGTFRNTIADQRTRKLKRERIIGRNSSPFDRWYEVAEKIKKYRDKRAEPAAKR